MRVYNFGEKNSILNHFVSEIRDEEIQKDRMRFRKNIERIGEVLAYEMSKEILYTTQEIKTPLGVKKMSLPEKELVLCAVLRAGLPLYQGVLNYFDFAESSFISAYREHTNSDTDFEIITNYLATPSLEGKVLVIIDPMLATGSTLETTYKALQKQGEPKEIHIISVIGSAKGVAYVQDHFPVHTSLWIGAIDKELNNKGYIIPGLGDAGDLAYGSKL